jgi:heme-degrading monooxygenase HmoA
MISKTPEPPYWAVIFTSVRTEGDDGYAAMAEAMDALAAEQPGFLGHEFARDGLGISVVYFRDLESIAAWRENARHKIAQQAGRERWYQAYKVRIAHVERDYGFERDQADGGPPSPA